MGIIGWGLLTLFGAAVIAGIWEYFVDSIKKCMRRIIHALFKGLKCFIRFVGRVLKEIIKIYNYDENKDQWTVETTTTIIPEEDVEDEIPADILAQAPRNGQEKDVTNSVLKLVNAA
jgi:hypothetical protein